MTLLRTSSLAATGQSHFAGSAWEAVSAARRIKSPCVGPAGACALLWLISAQKNKAVAKNKVGNFPRIFYPNFLEISSDVSSFQRISATDNSLIEISGLNGKVVRTIHGREYMMRSVTVAVISI